ncbi:OsABCB25 [Symbiodinium sp. CCMP2592]|nr:OsABCB25 [Symbiodinium sp. CCMP2592]
MTEAGSPAALLDAVTSLRSSFARLELRSQALARSRRSLRDRGVQRALSKPAQAHAEDLRLALIASLTKWQSGPGLQLTFWEKEEPDDLLDARRRRSSLASVSSLQRVATTGCIREPRARLAWNSSDASADSEESSLDGSRQPAIQELPHPFLARKQTAKKGSMSMRPFSAVNTRHMQKVRKQYTMLEIPPDVPASVEV